MNVSSGGKKIVLGQEMFPKHESSVLLCKIQLCKIQLLRGRASQKISWRKLWANTFLAVRMCCILTIIGIFCTKGRARPTKGRTDQTGVMSGRSAWKGIMTTVETGDRDEVTLLLLLLIL